jgi:acyl-[acyl carrier protein]--UDP-N-acetylglucosamine O-acyltransferase
VDAIVSAAVLMHQFCRVGSYVMLQGGSRFSKDIPPYIIAGRDPIAYCGINIVGLRRHGFSNELIENIHNISVLTYLNSIEEKNIQEENSQLMYNDKINSIKLSNYEINQLMTMHIQENQPFIETPFFYFQ